MTGAVPGPIRGADKEPPSLPSATFALMESWFQESISQRGPMNPAADREQADALADMYRPVPGVVDEPVAVLRGDTADPLPARTLSAQSPLGCYDSGCRRAW